MSTKLVSPVLLFCCLLVVTICQLAAQERENGLPEEIEQYYGTCNVVNLYSTTDEREALFREPRYGMPLVIPYSGRLLEIRTLIERLSEMECDIDPGINRWNIPRAVQVPSGLAVVEELDFQETDLVRINITVYQDDRELVRRLVSEFDRTPGSTLTLPSQEELLTLISGKVARREIHTWVRNDGIWSKQVVNLILLDG